MRLIGMLDSPYVRRTAIGLGALGVAFDHEPVSVFTTFEQFRRINPVVKAPTLICEDGGVLMDSTLILQYVEAARFPQGSPLWSQDAGQRLRQFRAASLALAGCDKSVQLIYETQLRPATAQHDPWKRRVRGQFTAAFGQLEAMLAAGEFAADEHQLNHASLLAAVVWHCVQSMIPEELPASQYPQLTALSARCETLPLFRRYPPAGPGVPTAAA